MKKIVVFLLAFAMVISLAACGQNNKNDLNDDNQLEESQNEKDSNEDETDKAFEYGTDYIANHLKGDYSISYKMTTFGSDQETSTSKITLAKTKEGYYLKMDDDNELLYIKNGDKYDMYVSSADESFEKVPGVQSTEEEVKASTSVFLGYMSTYTAFKEVLNKSGSSTIAGRSCIKYSMDSAVTSVKVKMEYCIDKETGVCLKYAVAGSTGGESGGYEFECTEFKTSGVSLPKYN